MPNTDWTPAVDAFVKGLGNEVAPTYLNMAELRAATTTVTADGHATIAGYYNSGDGGGGIFRWDPTDTTSVDNGGTIITPTGELASLGRWKRIYEGEVNARWFGMHPGNSDNTEMLQKAVDWVQDDVTRNPGGAFGAGTVFIPMGYYRFMFDAGTSGLSTITIDSNYVTIRGEGMATQLTVRNHARPSQLEYFFTFNAAFKAMGGGVRDICFSGNSMLKWCIYLSTWHAATFENIWAMDVHSGIIDAQGTLSGLCGENIVVRHLDYQFSSGSNSCFAQYGVRFRSSAVASWSDSWVHDCVFVGVWDSGVVLDGAVRIDTKNIGVSNNTASTNTLDGTSKAGCKHAVRVTHTIDGTWSSVNGQHTIDDIYLETHEGSETVADNVAVLIEAPSSGGGYNRYNVVGNVNTSWNAGAAPALFRVTNDDVAGRVSHNTFRGNRRPLTLPDQVYVGTGVEDTYLHITRHQGTSAGVTDNGTRTYITTPGIVRVNQGDSLNSYHTADQVTNYERVRQHWLSNRYFIQAENGGTGALRPIEIRSRGGVICWQTPIAPTTGTVQITDSTNTANTAILGVNGTLSAVGIGAGVQIAEAVWPTINQSGTAGYTALDVNTTETATGSGAKKLIRAAVGGTERFSVDNVGVVRIAQFATGSRPSASVVGAGSMIYDSTLSKPVWSDGTVWRDAAGTAV